MKNEKILGLDSLRGLAAISVAFFHFKGSGFFSNVFFQNSWLMVDFFFVLSGFVIAFSYSSKLSSIKQIIFFQKKRFLRLYPLHLLTLLIFLGFEVIKLLFELNFNDTTNNKSFINNNASAFFANVLLIHNWIIPNLTFNYPSWSISAEFYIYALFALLIFYYWQGSLVVCYYQDFGNLIYI